VGPGRKRTEKRACRFRNETRAHLQHLPNHVQDRTFCILSLLAIQSLLQIITLQEICLIPIIAMRATSFPLIRLLLKGTDYPVASPCTFLLASTYRINSNISVRGHATADSFARGEPRSERRTDEGSSLSDAAAAPAAVLSPSTPIKSKLFFQGGFIDRCIVRVSHQSSNRLDSRAP
jgi:hypothetical protein